MVIVVGDLVIVVGDLVVVVGDLVVVVGDLVAVTVVVKWLRGLGDSRPRSEKLVVVEIGCDGLVSGLAASKSYIYSSLSKKKKAPT